MKKRGFTLIELLAVIVVLAIIALIATPIVMNVIKNAQKGATERSAERYVDAVELAIATNNLENGQIADGTYTVDADGNLVLGEKTLTVEVNGDKPEAGSTVTIQNGQVVPTGTNMTIGDYTVTINDKGSAVATAKGDAVVLCTATEPSVQKLSTWNGDEKIYEVTTPIVGVQATSDAPYALGAVYTCELGDGESRTFYVLKEDGNNVKLIMNENLGNTVVGAESGDNSEGPVTANAYLASQTSGWTKLTHSQITLPDAQDIADAMGDTTWFDKGSSKYGPNWVRTNLDGDMGPDGYWTLTSSASGNAIWRMTCDGYMNIVSPTYNLGVRPVITIAKANMSL